MIDENLLVPSNKLDFLDPNLPQTPRIMPSSGTRVH